MYLPKVYVQIDMLGPPLSPSHLNSPNKTTVDSLSIFPAVLNQETRFHCFSTGLLIILLAQIKIFVEKEKNNMYPKVKVRDEAQDVDEDDYATRFCKALDALSLHNFPSPPVKELEDNSLPSVVKIPKSYVSKPVMPMAPVSRGSAKSIKRKVAEEEKQNIRASSVPRPRAVLSSPDNDGLLKSKQKSRPERSSGLRNHNQCQNRHVQCKVVPKSIDAEGRPINKTRETNEAVHSRINPKVIRVSPLAEPKKRAYLRKG